MRIVGAVIFICLLAVMFVSLFHASTDMNMAGGMTDCPFMSHEEVVCPMSLADHIGMWKSVFLASASTFTLAFTIVGLGVVVATVAPNLFRRIGLTLLTKYTYPRERTYSFLYRFLQELFSNGILHPKLF